MGEINKAYSLREEIQYQIKVEGSEMKGKEPYFIALGRLRCLLDIYMEIPIQ